MTTVVRRSRDGVALAGNTCGPADGTPILLFHGGGQTRHAWGRSAARLGDAGYRATAYDLRGHGDSGWPASYDLDSFVTDIIDLAAAESRAPVVVGASLGGLSALLANATQAGEISSALVLVDVAPRLNPAGVDRILGFMTAHPDGFASLNEAAAVVAAYQPQRAARADPQGLKKNLRQRDGRWYWHWDPAMMATFQQARGDTLDHEIFYQAAEKLKQPILLVRGMLSDVVDEAIAREFQDRIPHARLAEVGQAGHMVAGDRNDVFLDAVMSFLGSVG